MSIESKHHYRFEYLKSDSWKSVRLEALVREKGKCQICGEESISNDAHHMWYPESIWDTTEAHLIVLCRTCHELIHGLFPECKTCDPEIGRQIWIRFRNSMQKWIIEKQSSIDGMTGNVKTKELREAYLNLKKRHRELQESISKNHAQKDQELESVLETIKKWHSGAK